MEKKTLILLILICIILASGCVGKTDNVTKYVCPDGSRVKNPSLCPKLTTTTVKSLENASGLQKDIDDGKSIMGFWPHPDDEVYSPGIIAMAGDKGNPIWIVHLISVDEAPEQAQEARLQAITWMTDKYLKNGGYINLEMQRGEEFPRQTRCMVRWEWSYGTIKEKFRLLIEEKRPDILYTFTPNGFCDMCEHGLMADILIDLQDELSYKPQLLFFVNMDQGPRRETNCSEYKIYPPNEVLDLNVYSETLGMTYWDAKVEFWQKYAPSVPPLNYALETYLDINDRKEYFMKVAS